MENHTITPWTYHSGALYTGSGKVRLLLADRNESVIPPCTWDDNLKFALRACNNHYELVEAAREVLMVLCGAERIFNNPLLRLNAAVLNATMPRKVE